MSLLAVFLAASAATVTSGAPSQAELPVYRVMCPKGILGGGLGTVFRAKDRIVTVAHVWERGRCRPKGGDVTRAQVTAKLDYVEMPDTDAAAPRYEVACEPFAPSQTYTAIGFPLGGMSRKLTHITLRPTGGYYPSLVYEKYSDPVLGLWHFVGTKGGRVAPGMSGGPVLNSQGKVVGMILAYEQKGAGSFVRALLDTPLCRDAEKYAKGDAKPDRI